jgi:hypothetical protein
MRRPAGMKQRGNAMWDGSGWFIRGGGVFTVPIWLLPNLHVKN